MKPTDLSLHVTNYLTRYLAGQRNLSPNTIKAYRDVFTLLLRFGRDGRGIAVERLCLPDIDVTFVEAFLDHLVAGAEVFNPHLEPAARRAARVLPLRAVGGARADAAMPEDHGDAAAAPCPGARPTCPRTS